MKTFLIVFNFCLLFSVNAQQTNESITIGGIPRTYVQYLPVGFNSATENLPLVVVLHGLGGTGTQMALAGFEQIGDTARFISVYPQGLLNGFSQTSWNSGLPSFGSTADDLSFFNQLLDNYISTYNVDASRIYFTGFSMGSIMSYHMACQMNDRITAIGCMAGTMTSTDVSSCVPSYQTPVIHLHGTADGTVPYNGTTGLSSVATSVNFWRNIHSCASTSDSTRMPDTASDAITVDRFVYQSCSPIESVELWRFNGADHVYLYQPVNDITESVEIWKFFLKWQKNTSGLTENKSPSVSISPNPSEGLINVESSYNGSFFIYSTLGEIVAIGQLSIGENKINLSHLNSGVYLIKMGDIVNRFVIK